MAKYLNKIFDKEFVSAIKNNSAYYIKGSSYLSITQIAEFIFSFISLYFFTNYAKKELYGGFAYTLAIISTVMIVTQPAVNNSITYSVAKGFEGSLIAGTKKRFKYSFVGTFCLIIIGLIMDISHGKKEVASALIAAAFIFPFVFPTNSYMAFLHGKKDFKKYSIFSMLSSGVTTASVVLVLIVSANLAYIVIMHLLSIAATNYIFWRNVKSTLNNHNIPDDFEKLSNNLTGLGILGTANSHIDRLMVGTFVDLPSLAVYNFSRALSDPLRTVGVFVNKLTFPQLAQGEKNTIIKNIKKLLPIMFIGIFLLIPVIIILIPIIISNIFPKYVEGTIYVQILVVATVLTIPGLLLVSLYFSHKAFHHIYYKLHAYSCIMNIPFLFVAGYFFGVFGIVIYRLCSSCINIIINLIIFMRLSSQVLKAEPILSRE